MSVVAVPKSLVLMLLFALLAACAGSPPREATVIRGEQDGREYRYLELPNRMRVLLVSDPQTDKAAASLHVRAGSGNDPRSRQGLAHFLEHMLFLGTAKYPDPGEYQEFISAHGGSHNAYTSVDHTNYFFDIEPGSLTPALDRFAQFFVAPLFNREYVEREMNAVDSEYKLGLKDDARREYDVLRELVQPGHPLGSLAVGNLKTLGEGESDIREDLLAFYATHYSANAMTLVVLGRESLDELQSMVDARFAAVADRSATELTQVPSMFAPGTLPLEVRIRPEQELRELTLLFPLPSARAHYAAKPLEYIGDLLGHEGPGSVLSVLKARGWAESLSAGAGLDLYGEDAFQLSLQLTEEGVAHYRDIVALLFRAIDQMQEGGVEEWRFREQEKLGDLAFRFREKGSPTGAVIALSNALQDYPVAEALRGPYLFRDYEPALIREYLGYLRPDNLLLTLSHRDVQTDRESRWFGTPYAVQKLDAGELARQAGAADGELALPVPNEFIPGRVALKPLQGNADRPALLADEPGYRMWHLQDSAYPVPKASIYLQLLSPAANDNARDAALAALQARLVSDALNEYAYPASLAGLQYSVESGARGLTVKIAGYDDKQRVLLAKVLQTLPRGRFAPDRFEGIKTEMLRDWANSAKRRPFLQLVDEMRASLVARSYRDEELRAALEPAGPEELERFVRELFATGTLEILVHGNFSADEARGIARLAHETLGAVPPDALPPVEVVQLPPGALVRGINVDHPDSALLMYLQGAAGSDAERARVALSAQILGAPFFNELRTERQLGYVAFAQAYPLHRVPALVLAVQSPVAAPGALAREFEAFLQRQVTAAQALDEASFARQRQALVDRLRESPKSLGERSERLWADAMLGAYGFDDRERVATQVERIGREEWVEYFRTQIAGAARRAMLLQSRGTAHAQVNDPPLPGRVLAPGDAWREDAGYFRFQREAKVPQAPAPAD
ncbi:MAG: insulinase family protein [Pseudomonadales bacterium]|nr:insulinase family protein [Gammaproteobacteria bacterium]MBP6481059.1 insulinase family protein [Pseudomonadales bacterium]MBP7908930.1 insulinase family protein [Pseudomonadales bacterium]